jgi:hypothetical protein
MTWTQVLIYTTALRIESYHSTHVLCDIDNSMITIKVNPFAFWEEDIIREVGLVVSGLKNR